MILHPEVDALEAVQVCFVEVFLVRLLVVLGRCFGHFADNGAGQLQRQRLQRTEHEVEVQHGEEHNIERKQSLVVEDGNEGVEDDR